ncbi:MAG TPA: glycosyl hydrolase [Cyclobacteriaceae bacterium]|nr:glycosyl hydrolase [Cyclobacteriaceae bacterium]
MKYLFRVFLVLLILSWTPNTRSDSIQAKLNEGPFKALNFLYSISGKKTLSGIHNREPNATPARWTDEINKTTGKFPALWSGDFLFQEDNIANRQMMIDEAVSEWQRGAVINLMWHACNPVYSQPCGWDDGKGVLSTMTDEQWNELLTDGTLINMTWKKRVDEVCRFLQELEDKGVEVLWRPLHEMNQGKFWWGGRPGENGTIKLWRRLHDYMTSTKGLTNLIWVWDIQDFDSYKNDAVAYNPGENYFDVAAMDIYDDKTGYTKEKYKTMIKACGGKPIAIGECQKLPTAAELKDQSRWTFFMSWSELTYEKNTSSQIRDLYTSDNILTLDEMPGWKGGR